MAKQFIACSIDGCNKPRLAKSMCAMHYERNRQHGDPLYSNGTPPGEAKRFFEDVALHYEGNECLEWPYHRRGRDKYAGIKYNGKMQLVSRLVCEAVHGPPPTPEHEAAHSCGNGHEGCVTKGHLSWKTPKENQSDKLIHGTHNRGQRSGMAKITDDEAREILALRGKEARAETAKRFGISKETISRIRTGKSWAWLQEPINDRC